MGTSLMLKTQTNAIDHKNIHSNSKGQDDKKKYFYLYFAILQNLRMGLVVKFWKSLQHSIAYQQNEKTLGIREYLIFDKFHS